MSGDDLEGLPTWVLILLCICVVVIMGLLFLVVLLAKW